VLKLVENLTAEAQEQLVEQMKLQWLRRAADQAEESLAHGRVVSQEEWFHKKSWIAGLTP
jgi:hypothetical protein